MDAEKRSGRQRLLVNRPYQVRFAMEILIVVVLATCVSALTAYILTGKELESGFFSVHRSIQDIRQLLLPVLMVSALLTFLAMAIWGIFITLKQTHRVIGPAKRMERKFLEMSKGDFHLMHSFREGDVLKGLDDFINLHLNNLSDYFIFLERSLADMRLLIEALEKEEVPPEEFTRRMRDELIEVEKYGEAFKRGGE